MASNLRSDAEVAVRAASGTKRSVLGAAWVLAGVTGIAGCGAEIGAPERFRGEGTDPAAGSDPEAPEGPNVGAPDPGPGVGRGPDAPPPLEPLTPVVRRLTKDELIHTVEDTFGLELTASDRALIPDDRPLEGFVNIATGQTTLPEHVQAYAELARRVAGSNEAAAFMARFDCDAEPSTCAADVVRGAGAVLFRAPPAEDTVARYAAVFDAAIGEGYDASEAARFTLEAMLQAPELLYRLENETGSDGVRTVGGHEMATRLSYLMWASAPDEGLRAGAAAGDLDTASGVLAAAERLLTDRDKLHRALDRFIIDWSGLASIPDDDGLKDELTQATARFYERFVDGDGDLLEVWTEPSAVLTPELARARGLAPEGPGLRAYDLSDDPEGRGLLAQPGVIAGMTNADGGAIVARGLFLQRQLFCGESPDPPASLQASIDAFAAEQPEDASERQIADTRLQRNECAACHAAFDPLAYGFERFDHRGALRTEDEHGNTLHTDGWIPAQLTGGAPMPYADLDDYMGDLSTLRRVKACWVQRQLEFALGHRLDAGQARAVDDLVDALEGSDGTYDALIRALVVHDVFRTSKRAEDGP